MAPARPLWSDAGNDEKAVAKLLRDAPPATFAPGRRTGDPKILHRAAILVLRDELAISHGEADRVLSQEVAALDELMRAANLLLERLREWYALHAPEAVRAAQDPQRFAAAVAQHGDRAAVTQALQLAKGPSIGSDLPPQDMVAVRSLATALQGLHDSWRDIETRIVNSMDTVAPTLGAVVGPMVGARLIAHAGGLERLAVMPAGTVQTLGAETALFRHLRENAKPPKHGLLFQHPYIFQAPPWQRGAIARAMANTAVLAARVDTYASDRAGKGEELRARMEKDIAAARTRKAKAPARPPRGRPGAPRKPPGKGRYGGKGRGAKPGGPTPGRGRTGGPRGKPGSKPGHKPGGKPGVKPGGKPRQGGRP